MLLVIGTWCVAAVNVSPAAAGDWATKVEPAAPPAPWREVSVGVIATPSSWVAYSSTTYAPFAANDENGLRARVGGGYGQYRYVTLPPKHQECAFEQCRKIPVAGQASFVDALFGYQIRYGSLTAKAFAGYASDTQLLAPFDTLNRSAGKAQGFKAVLETWYNISPRLWTSVDASWTQAHAGYQAQLRLGYRLTPQISIGLEEGALGNVAGQQWRSGAFANFAAINWEVRVSAGIAVQAFDFRQVSTDNAYGAVNLLIRY
jgi:hypothetical protein